MNEESLLAVLDIPQQFGVTLLLLGLVLFLAPYLAGQDFGFIKIPAFAEKTRRRLRIFGPITLLLALAIHIPVFPGSGEIAQTANSECRVSGVVFDSDANEALSAVWIDFYRDMSDAQQRPQLLMTSAATTGLNGEFSFRCDDIDEDHYPVLLAARHREWVATRITGPKIERPSTWNDLRIAIPMNDIELKPLQEISVSFSGEEVNSNGFIIGEIENKSGRSFDCLALEFGLSTHYQDRIEGKPVERLGVVEVEIRDLAPEETRPYRAVLPQRAAFGLDAKREC